MKTRTFSSFILVLIIIILIITGCRQKPSYVHNSENFELIELADGVYACIHKFGGKAICNVGIIDNGNETLIFDTFLSPQVAEELLVIVNELGLSPIKYVVNSHFHNDHIRGNQVFPDEVDIISTAKTAQLIAHWEPLDIAQEKLYAPERFIYYDSLFNVFKGDTNSREFKQLLMWKAYFDVLSISHKEVVTRLPTVFVEDRMLINGPLREIQLITIGGGHTDSDIILYLPEDKIIFTGDLVFNDMHPYMPQGHPKEWKDWLTYMSTLQINKVVPGHGNVGGAEEMNEMKVYIQSMENLAIQMHENNIPIEEVGNMDIPLAYRDYFLESFYISNLKFLYEEISAQD